MCMYLYIEHQQKGTSVAMLKPFRQNSGPQPAFPGCKCVYRHEKSNTNDSNGLVSLMSEDSSVSKSLPLNSVGCHRIG